MQIVKILFIWILLFNPLTRYSKEKSEFISPLKIPLSLSANFGELRIDHFHSGLDIRTQGKTGKEVFATDGGYIYRISVSPGGFGKALYIRHPSGYSTVYAHLDRFIPAIEDYVIARQYEEKSYMITLWPPRDKFRIKKGDLRAYSGNSGSSTGPHLHYEIRKSDDETPVNPLQFEFGIKDDIKPVIEKLVIYPIGKNSSVNNLHRKLSFNTAGSKGNYRVVAKSEITVSGSAGFGIKSYDLQDNNYTRFSVYSIELKIDSVTIFDYRMNSFSFDESRYINSHVDYETYQRENIYIERGFVLPNDHLNAYSNLINRGIYNFSDGRQHRVNLIVSDIFNNRSELSFKVRSVKPRSNPVTKASNNHYITMPYDRHNRYSSSDVIVDLPSGALYDTLYFRYSKSEGTPAMYSGVHHIHNIYTPVQIPFSLSIRPDRVPAGRESKLIIVNAGKGNVKTPLITTWKDGFLKCTANNFGDYYVGIDTVPPVITPVELTPGANLTGRREMKIKLYDDFSGIKSYEPFIDDKWALFEYDQKNNVLIYRFDPGHIQKGETHQLSLKVTDNCDNVSSYSCIFKW